MVKFSKELEAQLIPEWKDAFVNYWQLKKHVKKIKMLRKPKLHDQNRDFGLSIFDPIRSIVKKTSRHLFSNHQDKANSVQLQVQNVFKEQSEEEDDSEKQDEEAAINESEHAHLFSEEHEVKVFYEKLDEELDKVNQFYKTKEAEFFERGEILNKQLQILLDLKQIRIDRRHKKFNSGVLSRSYSSSTRNSDNSESGDDLSESVTVTTQTDEVIAALERNGVNFIGSATRKKIGKPKVAMRIDIPATTPTRTISAVTAMLWEDLVNNPKKEGIGDFVNRKKIQCAEKMIRAAFVELYKGLGLLKNYSSLNMVAFIKIIKKFDKVANQQASSDYLKMVKRSHFISSDKVVKLMDEVENVFTQHFANSDRKKAMKFLKPHENKESHMVTFLIGLFTGSFITLFTIYAILAHLSDMWSPSTSSTVYFETIYPVFSMFALLSLHVFMYGCNLFMWKKKRINYNFIFDFSPKTALKYRDAFLICTSMMTAVVGAMVMQLILRANDFSPTQVDAIPGILLLLFMALLICPFNIFYRPTRYCFIRIIRNIVCSPLYKVMMVDFFMADQLTSQIPLLRHMESTACYFLAGSFKTHRFETCKSGKLYRQLAYVISFSPYYWRAMQCARRWFDECDVNHLANMGKYVSAMVAAGARLTYATEDKDNYLWLVIVVVTSAMATIYQLYWDFVKDWGFLDPKSKNFGLRDELLLKNKSIYYISIALNVVLRVVWVETVLRFKIGIFESRLLEFLFASLEVIRRGHWNFYRLENEHLNNVGKFRAVKTVPLPFRETDSDG